MLHFMFPNSLNANPCISSGVRPWHLEASKSCRGTCISSCWRRNSAPSLPEIGSFDGGNCCIYSAAW